MKFICPSCERVVELASWSVDGATLVVDCSACEAKTRLDKPFPGPRVMTSAYPSRPLLSTVQSPLGGNVVALRPADSTAVEAARDAARGEPFRVPADCCPKCVAKKPPQAMACPQCGLDFSRDGEVSPAMSSELKTEWVALLQDWGSEAHHKQLLEQAAAREELVAVGWLYRLALARTPGDARAVKGRDEVLRRAALPHSVANQATRPPPKAGQYVLIAALVVATLGALTILVRALLDAQQ
jgi:hypothetical protein